MTLLLRLSLRNLLRQKRRNVLLGTAMALGVMILIVANSFSHGISDIMFNKIMRWVTGHVSVRFNEKGGIMREIFRDRERARAALEGEPDVEQVDESIGYFMRAIGNGKSDNIILVGVNTGDGIDEKTRKEVEESFRLVEGRWEDLRDPAIENPAIVSLEKARTLNVKKNDVLRVRFRNMFAQDQAARLTVVGIMKNDNIFMQPVIFVELSNTKAMLGFRPYETASLSLKVANPQKTARALADRIHDRLKPGLAFISGEAANGPRRHGVTVVGYKSDDASKQKLSEKLKLTAGTLEAALKSDGVILPQPLAEALALSPGEAFGLSFDRKFEATKADLTFKVSAVCRSDDGLGDDTVLMNDDKFYDAYYENLPANSGAAFTPGKGSAWAPLFSPEWILLDRTANTDDYKKKYMEMSKKKWKGTTVDVSTMYETASDILKLEGVLNLITLSAVMVLFFIILLGVVNTLRMTIRERTREIGTVRAIGMQQADVKRLFVLETFFLTLFASAAGTLAGFAAMAGLSRLTFHLQDNPFGMLFVNGHLHFVPTFLGVAGNNLLISAIAVVTAYFPARRAARLSPAKALRHFE
ncbi:MAG: ABC transporter permease [Elusimicrobia bacterium]|nr:ABC transporter permease [Elusimicrobiota bacterium]